MLQGQQPKLQTRTINHEGHIKIEYTNTVLSMHSFFKQSYQSKQSLRSLTENKKIFEQRKNEKNSSFNSLSASNSFLQVGKEVKKELIIYSYYVSVTKISAICKSFGIISSSTKNLEEANVIFASKMYFKKNLKLQQRAKGKNIPVYLVNNNTISQITNLLRHLVN